MAEPQDRAWWRKVKSPEEFCAKAELRDHAKNQFLDAVKAVDEDQINDFAVSFLINKMGTNIVYPLRNKDSAIKSFIILGKNYDDGALSRRQKDEAMAKIEAMLNPRDKTTSVPNITKASEAFDRTEKPNRQGRFPSQAVFTTLMQQIRQYGDDSLAPYTTIVGPSGIGKSFAVKQLAIRHGMYIVYNNLASAASRGFPRPVTMGATPELGEREAMIQQWIVYLEQQLLLADCCKRVGITAPGLFHLLTSVKEKVLVARATIQTLITTAPEGADKSARVCDGLAIVRDVLETLGLNNTPDTQPKDAELPVIVCFDEARSLLDGVDDSAFRSLRQAAQIVQQNLYHGERSKDNTHRKTKKTRKVVFFMVLIDTTSRISNCTPPLHHDRSAKVANQRIFHPIFLIDSLDIFAPNNIPEPTGREFAVKSLFSFGRPLWGALLIAGYSWENLLRLATDKITGYSNRVVNDIAILSFRMNFYVSSTTMAKDLVASMMRYLVAISPDRNDLITAQPSEPVLAFAASKLLQDPSARLACVRAWIRGLHSGAINPGDIGEQVASLLLLFAFDCVAFGTPAGLNTPPSAAPIGDFIAALLGDQVWNDLCRRHAGTDTGLLLQEGTVFFNHFVRTSAVPTLAMLENAYRRGAALFLPARFPGMDVALPVRASPGGPLALLLLQVKNRKGDTSTPGLRLSMAEDLRKAVQHLGLSSDLHSVLGLVMCLRTQGDAHFVPMPPGGTEDAGEAAVSRYPTRFSAKGKEKASASSGQPGNLLGIAFGLGPSVYACLGAPSRKRKRTGRQAASGQGQGPNTGQAEMAEVSRLLERLVGSWPNAYAEEDTESRYAQRLLDPFYDIVEATEAMDEDTEDDDISEATEATDEDAEDDD